MPDAFLKVQLFSIGEFLMRFKAQGCSLAGAKKTVELSKDG